MSIKTTLYRQPIDKIFPHLSYLKDYHKYYTNIVHIMQLANKNLQQDISHVQNNIQEFGNKMENIVNIFVQELDDFVDMRRKEEQGKYKIQQIQKMQMKQQRIIRKQHTLIKLTSQSCHTPRTPRTARTPKCSKSPLRQKLLTQQQKTKLKQQITHQYSKTIYRQQSQYIQKLKPNPKTCQTKIRFLHYSQNHKKWLKSYKFLFNYIFCQQCQIYFRVVKANHLYRKHSFEVHNRKSVGSLSDNYVSIYHAYQYYRDKVDKGQLVIYKCNCQKQPYKTQQQYTSHIFKHHQGIAPTYSSHLFLDPTQTNSIVINKQYDQYLLIQDLLLPEMYYCGICAIPFIYCSKLYYQHVSEFHYGCAGDLSSHILTSNQSKNSAVERSKKISKQKIIQKNPIKTFQSLQKTPKIKQKKQSKKRIKRNQTQFVLAKNQKEIQQQLSSGQKTLQKIIELYQGPFVCRPCQTIFKSYAQMKLHFQKGKTPQEVQSHFFARQYFAKITVHRINYSKIQQKYYIPVQADQELKKIEIEVPIKKSKEVSQYKIMKYEEFINLILMMAKQQHNCSYTYSWYYC